jgi:hypothetical protein
MKNRDGVVAVSLSVFLSTSKLARQDFKMNFWIEWLEG